MNKLAIDGGSKAFDKAKTPVPGWPPVYPETEKLLIEIYRSQAWSFNGKYELQFDDEFAKYHDAKSGIFMVNGTVTLECALAALGVGPGDEVIVPAHTWIATGMAPLYVGATPVIVDVEADTYCMSPAAFEAAITPKTKVVIPVHLFGSMANIDEIKAIADKHGIAVIEDCAHAHGGKWNGRGLGSIGDIGSFSFQQSKTMTSGEGGMCVTSDERLTERLDRLKHIGYPRGTAQGKKAGPPEEGLLCHNYRATEFQAAILLGQLQHLKADTAYREENAEYLRKRIDALPGIHMQARGKKASVQSYYMFSVTLETERLKAGIDRMKVVEALFAEGIDPGIGWNGATLYKQDLWNIPKDKYRIESTDNALEICGKRQLVFSLYWLNAERAAVSAFADAFEKVMTAYAE